MAARLLIALKWKTGFEMGIVQKQTNPHSLDGDDEQKNDFWSTHPGKWRIKRLWDTLLRFISGLSKTHSQKNQNQNQPQNVVLILSHL